MNEETNTSIFDVAKCILGIYDEDESVDQITLYKLLWFCQGWHYYIVGTPLFNEQFEARRLGPVPKDMWEFLKGNREVMKDEIKKRGNLANIGEFSKEVVRRIAGIYSQFDPYDLSELSHQCTPWEKYVGRENNTIPNDELGAYFIEKGKSNE